MKARSIKPILEKCRRPGRPPVDVYATWLVAGL
jgi:hypothetical protein